MDSSLQSTTSLIDGKHSTIALSEREKFLSTYVRDQPWSLPDSVIYYVLKNPSKSKVYQKMIQSCKYFFIKNPLLVVKNFNVKYKTNQCITSLNGKNVNLNRVSNKLWITDELFIYNFTSIPSNSLTTVLSKIYQSDVKELNIYYQRLYISDLQFLASKCEKINLDENTVINEDDSVAKLEKIIEVLPKIIRFRFYFSQNLGSASQNVIKFETVEKLIQIPHFPNLEQFSLSNVPEIFDIDIFYDYIKKNKKTRFYLHFNINLSQQYQTRLQTIVNEIIETQNHDYKVPQITFFGIDVTSAHTLLKLCTPF